MATKITRIYKCTDTEMLLSCDVIILHAIEQKPILVAKRSIWYDPFFPNLQARIANGFSILGIDNAKQLRDATNEVIDVQSKALKMLAEFKIQIEIDFKKDKNRLHEILTILGFTANYSQANIHNDQEALVKLLMDFKENMTPQLKTEISDKGTSPQTIDEILSYTDTFKNYNEIQEAAKGSRPVITDANITEFNAIYEEVIGVAQIAYKFFIDNISLREQFSFKKTLSRLNPQQRAKKNNKEEEPEQ